MTLQGEEICINLDAPSPLFCAWVPNVGLEVCTNQVIQNTHRTCRKAKMAAMAQENLALKECGTFARPRRGVEVSSARGDPIARIPKPPLVGGSKPSLFVSGGCS